VGTLLPRGLFIVIALSYLLALVGHLSAYKGCPTVKEVDAGQLFSDD
jgi:hypothetical protein